MSLYGLSTTTSLASSSAFKGKNSNLVVALSTATQKDLYLQNGFFSPSTVPAGHFATGRFPNFGKKIASNVYSPNVIHHQPFGSKVPLSVATNVAYPASTAQQSLLHWGHATHTSAFFVQDMRSFFNDALTRVRAANATGLTIGTAAQTFLDNMFAGQYATYGASTNGVFNIPTGNWIYDANTTATGHKDLTSGSTGNNGTIGSTGPTAVFSYGDINIDSVVNSTTATDLVIILCVGKVSFANASWQPGTRTAPVLIIATDTIKCLGSNKMSANDFVISGVSLSVNSATNIQVAPTNISGNQNNAIFFNGALGATSTPTNYLFDQYTLATDSPLFTPVAGVVPHGAGTYADLPEFNVPGDDATLASFSGTVSTYLPTAISGSFTAGNFLQAATNIMFRECCQHQVIPQFATISDNVVLQAGCYYLLTTFFGVDYTVALSMQTTATQVPNFGVSTEYHNFADNVQPDATDATAVWMETYRIADLVYAPKSTGRYITLGGDGSIAISSVDYVMQTLPYSIETTLVTALCTLSLSDAFPPDTTTNDVDGTTGGMDAYVVTNNKTANVTAMSTYRTLVKQPPTTLTSPTTVTFAIPDRSWVDIAPFCGEVASADTGFEVIDGRVRVVNPDRRAKIMTINVMCTPSAVVGETFDPYFNGAGIIPAPPLTEFVTYKSTTKVRFSIVNGGTSENYTLDTDSSVLIGASRYDYAVVGQVGTLTKTSGGITATVGAWTFAITPVTPVPVFYTIIFGDTLLLNTTYQLNTILDNSVPDLNIQKYFDNAIASFKRVSVPAGQPMRIPGLTVTDIANLAEWGVVQQTDPDYFVSKVFHDEAKDFVFAIIHGQRISPYVQGQTKVAVRLADDLYVNESGNDTIVSNGLANVADMPIDFGNITYTAVQVPGAFGTRTVTIGVDFQTFTEADNFYGLSHGTHGKPTGTLKFAETYANDGSRIDGWTGSGSVEYFIQDQPKLNLVFP
jgi:hypothetical protein